MVRDMLEREKTRFNAVAEDGTTYTVIEIQRYSVFRPLSGAQQERPSSRRYQISTGEEVTPLDGETFQIVCTEQVIRKV